MSINLRHTTGEHTGDNTPPWLNFLSRSFQKLEPYRQTDRHTHKQTDICYRKRYHEALVGGIIIGRANCPHSHFWMPGPPYSAPKRHCARHRTVLRQNQTLYCVPHTVILCAPRLTSAAFDAKLRTVCSLSALRARLHCDKLNHELLEIRSKSCVWCQQERQQQTAIVIYHHSSSTSSQIKVINLHICIPP